MKRCFNTQEAMNYLGVKSRFFDNNIAPMLKGKGIKAGTSIVYERVDIDAAWDRYKLMAGSERANDGAKQWDVQRKATSTRQRTGNMKLMQHTGSGEFEKVVSNLSKKQKTTSLHKSS